MVVKVVYNGELYTFEGGEVPAECVLRALGIVLQDGKEYAVTDTTTRETLPCKKGITPLLKAEGLGGPYEIQLQETRPTQIGACSEDEEEAETDVCRICRAGSELGALITSCACSGSIRYVHRRCLVSWIFRQNTTTCELCRREFRLTKLYMRDAPDYEGALTVKVVIQLLRSAVARVANLGISYAYQFFKWVVVLPIVLNFTWKILIDLPQLPTTSFSSLPSFNVSLAALSDTANLRESVTSEGILALASGLLWLVTEGILIFGCGAALVFSKVIWMQWCQENWEQVLSLQPTMREYLVAEEDLNTFHELYASALELESEETEDTTRAGEEADHGIPSSFASTTSLPSTSSPNSGVYIITPNLETMSALLLPSRSKGQPEGFVPLSRDTVERDGITVQDFASTQPQPLGVSIPTIGNEEQQLQKLQQISELALSEVVPVPSVPGAWRVVRQVEGAEWHTVLRTARLKLRASSLISGDDREDSEHHDLMLTDLPQGCVAQLRQVDCLWSLVDGLISSYQSRPETIPEAVWDCGEVISADHLSGVAAILKEKAEAGDRIVSATGEVIFPGDDATPFAPAGDRAPLPGQPFFQSAFLIFAAITAHFVCILTLPLLFGHALMATASSLFRLCGISGLLSPTSSRLYSIIASIPSTQYLFGFLGLHLVCLPLLCRGVRAFIVAYIFQGKQRPPFVYREGDEGQRDSEGQTQAGGVSGPTSGTSSHDEGEGEAQGGEESEVSGNGEIDEHSVYYQHLALHMNLGLVGAIHDVARLRTALWFLFLFISDFLITPYVIGHISMLLSSQHFSSKKWPPGGLTEATGFETIFPATHGLTPWPSTPEAYFYSLEACLKVEESPIAGLEGVSYFGAISAAAASHMAAGPGELPFPLNYVSWAFVTGFSVVFDTAIPEAVRRVVLTGNKIRTLTIWLAGCFFYGVVVLGVSAVLSQVRVGALRHYIWLFPQLELFFVAAGEELPWLLNSSILKHLKLVMSWGILASVCALAVIRAPLRVTSALFPSAYPLPLVYWENVARLAVDLFLFNVSLIAGEKAQVVPIVRRILSKILRRLTEYLHLSSFILGEDVPHEGIRVLEADETFVRIPPNLPLRVLTLVIGTWLVIAFASIICLGTPFCVGSFLLSFSKTEYSILDCVLAGFCILTVFSMLFVHLREAAGISHSITSLVRDVLSLIGFPTGQDTNEVHVNLMGGHPVQIRLPVRQEQHDHLQQQQQEQEDRQQETLGDGRKSPKKEQDEQTHDRSQEELQQQEGDKWVDVQAQVEEHESPDAQEQDQQFSEGDMQAQGHLQDQAVPAQSEDDGVTGEQQREALEQTQDKDDAPPQEVCQGVEKVLPTPPSPSQSALEATSDREDADEGTEAQEEADCSLVSAEGTAAPLRKPPTLHLSVDPNEAAMAVTKGEVPAPTTPPPHPPLDGAGNLVTIGRLPSAGASTSSSSSLVSPLQAALVGSRMRHRDLKLKVGDKVRAIRKIEFKSGKVVDAGATGVVRKVPGSSRTSIASVKIDSIVFSADPGDIEKTEGEKDASGDEGEKLIAALKAVVELAQKDDLKGKSFLDSFKRGVNLHPAIVLVAHLLLQAKVFEVRRDAAGAVQFATLKVPGAPPQLPPDDMSDFVQPDIHRPLTEYEAGVLSVLKLITGSSNQLQITGKTPRDELHLCCFFWAQVLDNQQQEVARGRFWSTASVFQRCAAVATLLLHWVVILLIFGGLLPLLAGLLAEVSMFAPTLVRGDQCPRFSLFSTYTVGLVYLELWIRTTISSPGYFSYPWKQHWLKLRDGGLRGADSVAAFKNLAYPLLRFFIVMLSVPYCIHNVLLPVLAVHSEWAQTLHYYRVTHSIFLTFVLANKIATVIVNDCKPILSRYCQLSYDERYLMGVWLHDCSQVNTGASPAGDDSSD